MPSRYHPIEDGLWDDDKFDAHDELPDAPFEERAFFAWLSSNKMQRPAGIYRATDAELAASSHLPLKRVMVYLAELIRRRLVVRDGAWIFLPGYWKRQAHNPGMMKAARKCVESCSSPVILSAFLQRYPLHKEWLPNGCGTVSKPMYENAPTEQSRAEQSSTKEKNKPSVGSAEPPGFAALWVAHPGPKGPKQDAVKAYREVKPPENVAEILRAQAAFKAECDRRGEFCPQLPHLHRWLKKRRWEDELPMCAPAAVPQYPRL
jgi:hypothetical protein